MLACRCLFECHLFAFVRSSAQFDTAGASGRELCGSDVYVMLQVCGNLQRGEWYSRQLPGHLFYDCSMGCMKQRGSLPRIDNS